jgi:hypothetical protein
MGWGLAVMEYCEVGVPFIGPGRRGEGSEATGGGGFLTHRFRH